MDTTTAIAPAIPQPFLSFHHATAVASLQLMTSALKRSRRIKDKKLRGICHASPHSNSNSLRSGKLLMLVQVYSMLFLASYDYSTYDANMIWWRTSNYIQLYSYTLKVQRLNTANKQKSHGTPAPPNEFIAVLKLTVPGRQNISFSPCNVGIWLKKFSLSAIPSGLAPERFDSYDAKGTVSSATCTLSHCIGNFYRSHLEAVRTRVILKICYEPTRIESRNLVGNLLMNLKTSFSSMTWPNSIPNITQKTCPEPSGCPCSAHGGMKTLSSLCQLLNPKKRDAKNQGALKVQNQVAKGSNTSWKVQTAQTVH